MRETQNGDDWLERYTHDSLDIAPDDWIVQELLAAYPFEGGTIYRGMNFETEAQWEQFKAQTESASILSSGIISSWTRCETTANQFAITRPSYFLDRDTMASERRRSESRDYMIGQVGVILKAVVPHGAAIDVNKSKHGKEDEIILPPGNYQIEVHQMLRPFSETVTAENFEQELLAIGTKSDGHDALKLQHILRRFSDFSDQGRAHIFALLCGSIDDHIQTHVDVSMVTDRFSDDRRRKMPSIHINWSVPHAFFEHYDKFLPNDQLKVDVMLNEATRSLDSKFEEATRDIDWKTQHFDLFVDHSIAQAIKQERILPVFPRTVNLGIMDYYRHINSIESLREINDRAGKRQGEIRLMAQKMKHILSQMVRESPSVSRARFDALTNEDVEAASENCPRG